MNDRKLGLAAPRGRLAVFAGAAVALLVGFSETAAGIESFCPHGSSPDPAVLWCDDFDDSTPVAEVRRVRQHGETSFRSPGAAGMAALECASTGSPAKRAPETSSGRSGAIP